VRRRGSAGPLPGLCKKAHGTGRTAGSYAGGHLAAAAGNITGLEEKNTKTIPFLPGRMHWSYSTLFLITAPEALDTNSLATGTRKFPPCTTSGPEPFTPFFLGARDALVPVATTRLYQQKMKEAR